MLLSQLKEEVRSYNDILPRTKSEIEYLLKEGWTFLITDLRRIYGLDLQIPSSDPLKILQSIK